MITFALFVSLLLTGGIVLPASAPQSPPAPAQGNQSGAPNQRKPPDSESKSPDEPKDFRSLEAEMLERANIERRDAEQKRIVRAAEDILRWSQELAPMKEPLSKEGRQDAYSLIADIEKSARRIRSIYGVGATVEQLDSPPSSWSDGLGELEATAAQLLDDVKKTRRQVISVPVIVASDKIVLLCRWLREAPRANP